MVRKALGKGLGALIPDAGSPAGAADGAGPMWVSTGEIRRNRYQPRVEFEGRGMEELVASVREVGILQPLIVRRLTEGFELIAGERRLRAAEEAGLERVPAVVRDAGERESLALALVENLQRSDLTPLEEAAGYRELLERFGLTQEEVARNVGVSRSAVANTLRLLNLPEEVKLEVGRGSLSAGHARVLVGLRDAGAQLRAARQMVRRGLSVREAERQFAGAERRRKVGRRAGGGALEALGRQLSEALGTRVGIKGSEQRGRIEIEYYRPAQLEDLAKRLRAAFDKGRYEC